MDPIQGWKVYWLIWFGVGFGVAEFIAIKYFGVEATLSYTIWWGIDYGSDGVRGWDRWIFRSAFFVGCIWAVHHFFTQGNLFK
jgi:hypothetical protein